MSPEKYLNIHVYKVKTEVIYRSENPVFKSWDITLLVDVKRHSVSTLVYTNGRMSDSNSRGPGLEP